MNGLTQYGYDLQGNLTRVTDPRGNATHYTYDGLGNLRRLESPDTGTTVHDYDIAGNRIRSTDARGVVTEFSYDALNRLVSKTYPASPNDNVIYSYDSGTNGIGRLTGINQASGDSIAYAYDIRGNLTQETRVIAGQRYVTAYAYDALNNITDTVYPSGRLVTFARDALGRISGVTTRADTQSPIQTVAANITYQPFGPVNGFTYGNGLVVTLRYDQDGQVTAIISHGTSPGVHNLALSYNALGNITALANQLETSRNQNFDYDALSRLTHAQGGYGVIDYGYDALGNRTTRNHVQSGTTTAESYTYDNASNRLLDLAALNNGNTHNRSFNYDAIGNTVADTLDGAPFNFTYDATGRMIRVASAVEQTDYRYNALGQRIAKIGQGADMDYAALAQAAEALAQGHQATADNVTQQAQTLRDQADVFASQAQALLDHAATLQQRASIARSEADGKDTQAQTLLTQAASLRQAALAARAQADANDQLAADLIAQAPLLRNQATALRTEAATLEPAIAKLQKRIDNFNHALSKMSPKATKGIANLTAQRDTVQTELDPIQAQYDGLIAQAVALEAQADQNEIDAANLQQEAISLRAQADADEAQAVQNDLAAANLQQEAVTLRAQAVTDNAQATQRLADASALQQQADGLIAQATPLEDQAAAEQQLANNAQTQADEYWALAANPPTSTQSVHFMFDQRGMLIGEMNADSNGVVKEYIYLGNLPVAVVDAGGLYFIHSDHLGTPRTVTNTARQIVWKWDSSPFGRDAANDDPDGNGIAFDLNLRFPGQYFDAETGLHYNYFRDYDPSLGRYVESDPIGVNFNFERPDLQLTINIGIPLVETIYTAPMNHLYGYVQQNPMSGTDMYGLLESLCKKAGHIACNKVRKRCNTTVVLGSGFSTAGAYACGMWCEECKQEIDNFCEANPESDEPPDPTPPTIKDLKKYDP